MKNRASSIRAALIASASALVLSACASKPVPPPEISYDTADFKPAAIEKAPDKPVKIVEVPRPLPLPGQLQTEPGKVAEDQRSPKERVVDANKAATQEPTKHGYVNAVQVYPFAEGALYQLYTAPERVTDIALQAGETLTSVSAGDTVRWVIGDTVSGSGDNQRTHVLVKPFAPGLKTNLVVTTDRRSYHLQLESTEKTAMAAISWTYSEDQIIALRRRNAEAEAATPVASNVALDDIRFRYSITGDTPPWRPVRAFDDGHKVYIEFPRRIDQGEAPPLFVVGAKGDN
ncbi:MAG: P-type conjugative transfer protein TrbG, partial [Mesorhizobium sp.]